MSTKSFSFTTPVIAEYGERKGQTTGFLRISGTAEMPYYMNEINGEFDADLIDIKITNIIANIGNSTQDITFTWLLLNGTHSDFEDTVMNPCKAHMEYLFSEQYEKYKNEVDYTDTVQDEQ